MLSILGVVAGHDCRPLPAAGDLLRLVHPRPGQEPRLEALCHGRKPLSSPWGLRKDIPPTVATSPGWKRRRLDEGEQAHPTTRYGGPREDLLRSVRRGRAGAGRRCWWRSPAGAGRDRIPSHPPPTRPVPRALSQSLPGERWGYGDAPPADPVTSTCGLAAGGEEGRLTALRKGPPAAAGMTGMTGWSVSAGETSRGTRRPHVPPQPLSHGNLDVGHLPA